MQKFIIITLGLMYLCCLLVAGCSTIKRVPGAVADGVEKVVDFVVPEAEAPSEAPAEAPPEEVEPPPSDVPEDVSEAPRSYEAPLMLGMGIIAALAVAAYFRYRQVYK